ncbi:ribosome recycling factor [Salsipaludibacter albus]|uniref:ribosome recycling factor n=1 Tax=Salsipaludibacter albus TaxID=2849650 RepID=UPI001EE4B40F|nr:ribosome recycling factor [Salsipaludibacter albus]MBY5164088.1 ribosome recycling factor [Salsipaludibacter albus]
MSDTSADLTPDSVLRDASSRMDGAIERVREDFAAIRTGRANPRILNRIQVDYYGTRTPLQQLANFSVPEPRILVVNPFDQSTVNDIERAIRESDLGLNPSTDGHIIRCIFPELTEERRREYIKLARAAAEDGRIAIRNVRRDARDELDLLEEEGEISQDEQKRHADRVEEITKRHVTTIDELLEQKEVDLLEV